MTDSDLSIASSAKRITELAQTSALAEADLLVAERPGDSTYSTTLGLIKELVSQKADDKLGLGTAAYTEPCEYAPLAHAHDYSDFDFFPSYKKDDGTTTVQAGSFVIKKHGDAVPRCVEIRVPVEKPVIDTTLVDPKIGELRMLGVPNFERWLLDYKKYKIRDYSGKSNIDIYDPSFDGWVVPNGATFPRTRSDEFVAAHRAYGNPDGSFTVPLLSGFFKCYNNKNGGVQPLQRTGKKTVVKRHGHALNIDGLGQNDLEKPQIAITEFTLSATSGYGKINAGTIHRTGGSGSNVISCDFLGDSDYYDSKLSAFKFTCDTFAFNHWGYLDGSALSVTRLASSSGGTQTSILSTGSQTMEQYPDYQEIPALIYIGKRND